MLEYKRLESTDIIWNKDLKTAEACTASEGFNSIFNF